MSAFKELAVQVAQQTRLMYEIAEMASLLDRVAKAELGELSDAAKSTLDMLGMSTEEFIENVKMNVGFQQTKQ